LPELLHIVGDDRLGTGRSLAELCVCGSHIDRCDLI
jgi:hypothetical protein